MSQDRIFSNTLHNFPAIASLEIILESEPLYEVCFPIKSLLELCRHVSRDLAYVARLQEDVQDILDTCPEYHVKWISEVRIAASGALDRTNTHITTIVPGIGPGSSSARPKIQKLAKDTKPMASLERQLSIAHTSLLSVLELMHKLALQRGRLVPDDRQIQKVRNMQSTLSLERASTQSPGAASPYRF